MGTTVRIVTLLVGFVGCSPTLLESAPLRPLPMTKNERTRSDALAADLSMAIASYDHACDLGAEPATISLASRAFGREETRCAELAAREASPSVRRDLRLLSATARHRRRVCERAARVGDPLDREAAHSLALEGWGIDAAPRELARDARQAFAELRHRAGEIAAEVAAEHGLAVRDYLSVLAALKKEQIRTTDLIARYRERQAQIEAIVQREDLVSLPARPLHIRLGSREETARMPAPRYDPGPLFGGTREPGTFVIPLVVDPSTDATFDDFGFDGGMWWLTAHEGRPGHDLQYSTITELGTSRARGELALSAATIEGWGLYAESLLEPFVSSATKLAIVQARLMRAAHAFLDIELNLGLIDEAEVRRVMIDEVGFSRAWAEACIRRYLVLIPGQAPSYFYGYQELVRLRRDVERRLGPRFRLRAFHDAVIAQGFLPLSLLREALLEQSRAASSE